jgi:Fe-S cluster assembly protein SufD
VTLSSFTIDTDGLPGAPWLQARRRAAAERLGEPTLPTTDEEVWRYSRVDELDLDDFTPVLAPPGSGGIPAGAQTVLDGLGPWSAVAVVHNGFPVHVELAPEAIDRGVRLGPVDDLFPAGPGDDGAPAGPAGPLGALATEPVDVFGALNDVFTPRPLVLDVPAGVTLTAPVVVIDWVDADGGAVFPRLAVRLGEDAEAVLVDWHGSDDVVALVAPVVELDVARAGRLSYVTVQHRGPRLWQVAAQLSRADADATVSAAQVGLGGDYARTRADCRLVGRGASGNLRAVYFGEGEQMLDFRTFQDHVAPDTTSNLLFKGAVGDQSRSVYTGLIRVRKTARGTNAFQTNRNIKLSQGAWAESVPNLEIENNDVRCSHASTVGPVDEDQRFYLESRGVPTNVAERLIVAGFFAEVSEQLPVPELSAVVERLIDERLDRRDATLRDGGDGMAG